MDGGAAAAAATMGGGGGSGTGSGGPAPFLLKTYEMVDDSTTDDIVSWSPSKKSFVVWNPPEFARLLLPTYFKHNNFSSFIRQLNTYGFRKIDPERWEFANEDFVKDQKHLLKNIHRRKPIHSHSNPQGSTVDPERAAFEDEIDKLSRERTALEGQLLQFKQQASAKLQLEKLTQQVSSIERRQECLLSFLEKAVQNPDFVERLSQKLESMDFSAYNKKRRLPQVEHIQPVQETLSVDDNSCSKPGSVFHQDFCNKLRLELSPAVSDINLLSHSTQSSNEDGGSPQKRISERMPKDMTIGTGGVSYDPQAVELSDTGTSFTLNMDSSVSCKTGCTESPSLHSLQQSMTCDEECELISCQLNLTLASSPLQINKSPYSARVPEINQEADKYPESRSSANGNESEASMPRRSINFPHDEPTMSSTHDVPSNKQAPATGQARVNDVFWEQFLTERPGSDTEEASSCLRAHPYVECEERKSENTKNAEHLTL